MPDEDSDQLLTRFARGDRSAAREVLRLHAHAVQRLARAIVGDAALAEDVAQETFARALSPSTPFDPTRGSARTWLLAIARNTAFELLRWRREVSSGDATEAESLLGLGLAAGWGAAESPEALTLRAEARAHLARALATLPAPDREVLVLREVEGLALTDIAQMVGLDLAATKSRLHRARLRLMAAASAMSQGVSTMEREAGGLRCGDVLALLSDYVDDELGPTERAQVESHLRGCSVCERFGGRFSSTVHAVRGSLGAEPALDPALVASIVERLR